MLELAPEYVASASGSIKDIWEHAAQGSPPVQWRVSRHYDRIRIWVLRWVFWGLCEKWSGS